ncbi:hypothetical protein HMPREF0591_1452 [Mycobacterium parascrofulaceum ATCC BAA-614]|uniref:Uncharacterized protein n=1 Tax=Mycobacterium parascrofulaceum ATCC BAA-614 TaxID=525368 RepID=D5P5K8_9MYCO|nr:hypothetical protein [Mycobacterium parascrofulaceum]EFG78642.1 hypothetical protein HMPREF0591_1452 [Mycobacterium parascrofulaceum ATCC BAA-614]
MLINGVEARGAPQTVTEVAVRGACLMDWTWDRISLALETESQTAKRYAAGSVTWPEAAMAATGDQSISAPTKVVCAQEVILRT